MLVAPNRLNCPESEAFPRGRVRAHYFRFKALWLVDITTMLRAAA